MAAKRRGHTITLKGAAAKAFIEMSTGRPAHSEDDLLTRVATAVYMRVLDQDIPGAVQLLKDLQSQTKSVGRNFLL